MPVIQKNWKSLKKKVLARREGINAVVISHSMY
jgi:hypothetical protein